MKLGTTFAFLVFAAASMAISTGGHAAPPVIEPVEVTNPPGQPVQVEITNRSPSPVLFNDRIAPDESSAIFEVPLDKVLVITDIVVQNRAPGDAPVDDSLNSRLVLGQFLQTIGETTRAADIFLTVQGNDTLNLHFETGMLVPTNFRILNSISSQAPFVEFVITGLLRDQ
jgi:hypothetical protein